MGSLGCGSDPLLDLCRAGIARRTRPTSSVDFCDVGAFKVRVKQIASNVFDQGTRVSRSAMRDCLCAFRELTDIKGILSDIAQPDTGRRFQRPEPVESAERPTKPIAVLRVYMVADAAGQIQSEGQGTRLTEAIEVQAPPRSLSPVSRPFLLAERCAPGGPSARSAPAADGPCRGSRRSSQGPQTAPRSPGCGRPS